MKYIKPFLFIGILTCLIIACDSDDIIDIVESEFTIESDFTIEFSDETVLPPA